MIFCQLHFTDHFFETSPKYLMKTDDDVFVNLPKLYSLLTEDNTYTSLEYLLLGNVNHNTKKVLKVWNKFGIFSSAQWNL